MEKNRALEALRRNVSGKVESGEATPIVAMEGHTYHVARFDHERAAESLFFDLSTLEVQGIALSATAVWVRVPAGVDPDRHMTAVKAMSLGRGSHAVTREQA